MQTNKYRFRSHVIHGWGWLPPAVVRWWQQHGDVPKMFTPGHTWSLLVTVAWSQWQLCWMCLKGVDPWGVLFLFLGCYGEGRERGLGYFQVCWNVKQTGGMPNGYEMERSEIITHAQDGTVETGYKVTTCKINSATKQSFRSPNRPFLDYIVIGYT